MRSFVLAHHGVADTLLLALASATGGAATYSLVRLRSLVRLVRRPRR